jgi:hypothetical protein
MPLVGIEGGYLNLVPVDFVVDALVYLAHLKDKTAGASTSRIRRPARSARTCNVSARGAHAPEMAFRIDPKVFAMLPDGVARPSSAASAAAERVRAGAARPAGAARGAAVHQLPDAVRFERDARSLLEQAQASGPPARGLRVADCGITGSASSIPTCRSIAALRGAVNGKVVVVTGGSSGIGEARAIRIADAGGKVDRRARRGRSSGGPQHDPSRAAGLRGRTPATSQTLTPTTGSRRTSSGVRRASTC